MIKNTFFLLAIYVAISINVPLLVQNNTDTAIGSVLASVSAMEIQKEGQTIILSREEFEGILRHLKEFEKIVQEFQRQEEQGILPPVWKEYWQGLKNFLQSQELKGSTLLKEFRDTILTKIQEGKDPDLLFSYSREEMPQIETRNLKIHLDYQDWLRRKVEPARFVSNNDAKLQGENNTVNVEEETKTLDGNYCCKLTQNRNVVACRDVKNWWIFAWGECVNIAYTNSSYNDAHLVAGRCRAVADCP